MEKTNFQLIDYVLSVMSEIRLDQIEAPDDPVEDGEKVLGELPTELRLLDVALSKVRKNLELSCASLPLTIGKVNGELTENQQQAKLAHHLEHRRFNFLKNLLREEIRQRFPEFESDEFDGLALRAGWKVVGLKSSPNESITVVGVGGLSDLFAGLYH